LPTALPDVAVTTSGASIAVAVLSNDSGNALSIAGFTNPGNGSVSVGSNDTLIYQPEPGFVGIDAFSYTVIDGLGGSSQADVTVTVNAPNASPLASDDRVELLAGSQVVIPVLDNDIDPDGHVISIAAVTMPSHGVVEVLPNQAIRYTPQPGFVGVDSFVYAIVDVLGLAAQASVEITVRANDDPPLTIKDQVEASLNTPTPIDPMANDSDPEGHEIQLVGYTLPGLGTLSLNADRRTFTYTATSAGSDGFTYTVRDPAGNASTGFVAINAVKPNAAPQANDDQVTTEQGAPVTIDVRANDSDVDADELTIIALSLPSFGRLQVNSDQTLLYTPFSGAFGEDEFLYTVRDPMGAISTAKVIVTVTESGNLFANGFAARRRIGLPAYAQSAVESANAVILITVVDDQLRSRAHGGRFSSDSAFDLRFEMPDGTLLDHDLERYDPVRGELQAWVRLANWNLADRVEVFLYYDNPTVTADPSKPAETWRGYVARWNTQTGADSTANDNDLTPTNVGQATLVGPAGNFVGSSVLSRADASFQSGLSELTVQALIKADPAMIGADNGILTQGVIDGNDSNAGVTLQYLANASDGTPNVVHFKARTTDGNAFVLSSGNHHTTSPQTIHGTWRSGEAPRLFIDGEHTLTSSDSGARGGTTVADGPFYIGTGPRNSDTGGWIGLIDEVRLSDRAKPAAQIRAEAVNLTDPELFFGFGIEERPDDATIPPVALPVRVNAEQGEIVQVPVLDYALQRNGQSELSVEAVSQPSNGSVSVINDVVRYVPSAGFSGRDRFNYTISDGETHSKSVVEITVAEGESLDGTLPNGKRVLLMNQPPTRTVFATPSTVQSKINSAEPGDYIVLRSGNYNALSVNCVGTESRPIVLVSEQPLGAVLGGQVTVTGRWLKFDQFKLTGAGNFEVFQPAANLRFDRCLFQNNSNTSVRLWADVQNVRVSRCEGRNGSKFFIYCDIDKPEPPGGPQYVHIDHNYFTGYNTASCIRLGDTSHPNRTFELNAVVEYNLFDSNTGDRELIVGKSSRNWIRYNTMIGAYRGDISLRQGSFWNVYGNFMIGAGSITVTATRNRVYNNYIEDANKGIWLMSGDNTWDRTTTQRPIYDRAERCILANNTVILTNRMTSGIAVGENFGQTGFKVTDCDIVNNLVYRVSGNGPLINRTNAETDNRFAGNIVSHGAGYTGAGVTVASLSMTRSDGILRPRADGPARAAGVKVVNYGPTNLTIADDIDGTDRGSSFDVGADQLDSGTAARKRLSAGDVGLGVQDPYAA